MIYGIGTDLVEPARIARLLENMVTASPDACLMKTNGLNTPAAPVPRCFLPSGLQPRKPYRKHLVQVSAIR